MKAEKELSAIRGEQTLFKQPTNHPLITHLSPTFGSHLDAIRKYAAMVVLMLFIGVGQMWGGPSFNGGDLYFYNKGNWSDTNKQLCIGKDNYTSTYTMSVVTNTKLWKVSLPTSGWEDATYMAVVGNGSSWGSGSWGSSNLTNANHKTAAWSTGSWGFNSGDTYLFIPANGNDGASMSMTYQGKGHAALNCVNLTVNAQVSINGAAYTTPASAPAKITVSSTKFTAATTCTTAVSGTITAGAATVTATASNAGYTAKATYKVENVNTGDGYAFVGWYNSEGTQLSTSTTYNTSYPDADCTITARFTQTVVTPTISLSAPTSAVRGNSITLTASTSNVSTPTIVYQYSTSSTFASAVTDIASTTSTSQSWTVPTGTAGTTYYLRAKMTISGTTYTSSIQTLTAYGKKTIHVRNTSDWATFNSYVYDYSAGSTTAKRENWPGSTTGISNMGGQWKDVVLTSQYTYLILNDGSSTNQLSGETYTYSGLTNNGYYTIGGSGSSHTLTSTTAPAAPTVTTAAASSIATTSATLGGSVVVNRDKVTERGYYWGTNSALSSSNLGVGTKVTISGTNNIDGDFSHSQTGLTNGTTYYVIAYATNGFGTSYGSVVNFRTKFVTTVTLDKQGGTGGTSSVSATEGSDMPSGKTAPSKTGYTFGGYYKNTGGDGTQYYTNAMASAHTWDIAASTATIYAKWTAKTYDVTLNANEGTGDNQTVVATYDAAMPTTIKTAGTAIVAPTRTGYNFAGYYDDPAAGTQYYTSALVSARTWDKTTATTLYAHWTAKQSALTIDKQTSAEGFGTAGTATASASATYGAAMPSLTGTLPTAANGYAFMGFYDAEGGEGTKYYNADGTSAATWDKDTDGGITLYAYYKKAQITNLALDAAVVAPGGEVGVTPTVAPTPTGTNSICWKLLYSNGNLYSPQPDFKNPRGIANKVTFTAPSTSGTYLVAAVLRTGNDCNGTKLDSVTSSFQVAGDHNVTVQYKCGSEVIAPSTTVNGRPLVWSSAIAAPEIFGYTFHHWLAGDGITLSENGVNAKTGERADSSVVSSIYIKAIYDGKLTAVYTQNNIIYFKNTLGWSGDDIHVYFYNSSGYWNETKGAGAAGATCIGKGKMDIVPGETNIYYWDYSGITGGAAAATKHVAFTNKNEMTQYDFWDCEVVYPTKGNNEGFSTGTPMFVPISQEKVTYNTNADYYNKGYWTEYAGGTGYSVDIFFSKGGDYDKSIWFEEGETAGMPFTATAYLSGGTTLGFKIHRSSGLYYYSSTDVTMSNASTAKSLTYDDTSKKQTGITTNVTGEYTFTLTCGSDGKLNVTVKYPAAAGDYRLVYSDGVQTKPLVSDVVPQVNGGKDTVSFFVRPGSTPVLKIQRASVSAGVLSWGDYNIISSSVSSLAAIGVYNICLSMDGSGAISVENVEAYTGEFYIRTDAANNKWDNYRAPDHLMTYSEYSETYSDYTHYFMAYVANGKNVKFVVANDYSPCISDTLVQSTFRDGDSYHVDNKGNIKADANVRFMWNRSNNAVYRAYLAKAQSNGSKFLVLRANSETDLMDENGNALTGVSEGTPGNNHGGGLNCMQFTDNQNWIYEANVKVRPGAYVKLYAHFHDKDFYYRGKDNNTFDAPNAIQLITGEGDAVKVRVVYDFKTDRLLAAWMPEGKIEDSKAINADVMFVREGQGDISQLTFTESGAITAIKSAYGVMRFNKWTLNNKEKTGSHGVLSSPASIYERSLFWISFPFRVKLSEVFGFGTYGTHWAIQKYNGARRAAEGFWAESRGFWEWMDRNTEYLAPDQGYLLAIDLDLLGESASVWNNGVENVELYFPSYGTMPSITSANVEHTLPSHACTIDWSGRSNGNGGTLGQAYNRTVIDSHWNVMSVPTYVNTSNVSFTNEDWITAGDGKHGPNFLYTWNMDDNTLTPTAGKGYHYHAMHAYMVQYHGDVTWKASSGSPYPIVARRTYAEKPKETSFCMEIQQEGKMIDRTYVVLSNDEETNTEFSFGEDMGKEFNVRNANVYTIVEGYIPTAGNTLPMSEQTTVVPVGVKVNKAGEYTFAMPEGTNGTGVVLVDTENDTRTNLALGDYTVTLGAGTTGGRFVLEISPVANTPTGIDEVPSDQVPSTNVRKVMVDGVLYIVKDGKAYDARGTRMK